MFFRQARRFLKLSKTLPLVALAAVPAKKYSQNKDLEASDFHGSYPALVEAARKGEIWEIEYHLQYKAPLDKEGEPISALAAAAEAGKVNAVAYLISQGADLDYKCKGGLTPLMLAVSNGHLVCAEALLEEGCRIDIRDDKHRLPLHHALKAPKHKKEILELLIKVGCRPDDYDFYIPSPLHFAAIEGPVALKTLLKAPDVNVNVNWRQLGTPLFVACRFGLLYNVKILVENGADVNAVAEDGSTPLHAAAKSGNWKVVEYLIKHGAKFKPDKSNLTPLHVTKSRKLVNYFLKEFVQKEEITQELMKSVLNRSNKEVIEGLIKNGADVNALVDGESPLHIAFKNGDFFRAEYLITNNAKMDTIDENGYTPEDVAHPIFKKMLNSPLSSSGTYLYCLLFGIDDIDRINKLKKKFNFMKYISVKESIFRKYLVYCEFEKLKTELIKKLDELKTQMDIEEIGILKNILKEKADNIFSEDDKRILEETKELDESMRKNVFKKAGDFLKSIKKDEDFNRILKKLIGNFMKRYSWIESETIPSILIDKFEEVFLDDEFIDKLPEIYGNKEELKKITREQFDKFEKSILADKAFKKGIYEEFMNYIQKPLKIFYGDDFETVQSIIEDKFKKIILEDENAKRIREKSKVSELDESEKKFLRGKYLELWKSYIEDETLNRIRMKKINEYIVKLKKKRQEILKLFYGDEYENAKRIIEDKFKKIILEDENVKRIREKSKESELDESEKKFLKKKIEEYLQNILRDETLESITKKKYDDLMREILGEKHDELQKDFDELKNPNLIFKDFLVEFGETIKKYKTMVENKLKSIDLIKKFELQQETATTEKKKTE